MCYMMYIFLLSLRGVYWASKSGDGVALLPCCLAALLPCCLAALEGSVVIPGGRRVGGCRASGARQLALPCLGAPPLRRARCLGSGLGGSLLPSEAEGSKELNMGFNAYPFELKRGYENGPQNGVMLPVVLLS